MVSLGGLSQVFESIISIPGRFQSFDFAEISCGVTLWAISKDRLRTTRPVRRDYRTPRQDLAGSDS
jgi:hypothetical protein